MNLLRRAGLGFCTVILSLALVVMAWTHVLNATVQDKGTVKSWLEESGFYDKITAAVLEQSETSSEDSLPVDEPEVKKAINEAFSPEFLRDSVGSVLDGVYAWADGETDQPQFKVDISEAKQKLIDGLSGYAVRRASELPQCNQAEALQMAGEFDVLTAKCLPAGVSPEQAGERMRSELEDSPDFLPDTTFSPDNLKDENGNSVVWSDSIRDSYQRNKTLPYLMAVLAVAAIAGIVFASSTKRKGITRAGGILVFGGLAVGLSALVIGQGPNWINQKVKTDNLGAELITAIFRSIGSDASRILWMYAAGFVVLGALGIILAKFYNRKPSGPDHSETTDPVPPADDSPKQATDRTSTADQEKPAVKEPPKIQL